MPYTDEEMHADFEYYKENLADFYQRYGKCWIAIRNQEILGTFSEPMEAIRSLKPRYDIGEFSVQRVDEDESAYTIKIAGVRVETCANG